MTSYLALAAVVLAVNLMPVLGPPTWLVLVLFRLETEIPLVPLVVVGAVSATTGRVLLAHATRYALRWLPSRRVANLRAAGERLRVKRSRAALGLGVFLLSPLPSAQLFEAAGAMRLALRPLATAFLAGRVVTYGAYAASATAVDESLGGALREGLTSWPSIALQGVLLLGLWALGRVDWTRDTSRDTSASDAR
jgi:hypothetical protein